jgi:NAD(P)-dependent dehydrogenase (short-subunit alcohol dehydrogenase family)
MGDAVSVQVAIVAGAGGALGHATTVTLAAGGLTIVAVDRNEHALRELPDGVRREVADTTATALSYPWTPFICGHLGMLATRDDVAVHQAYIADIEASAREALATVDPTPFYMHYAESAWAGVKAHLDTVTERAAAPVIAKYTGVLAAADIEIFTRTTTFAIMQSLRLDSGPSGPVHP